MCFQMNGRSMDCYLNCSELLGGIMRFPFFLQDDIPPIYPTSPGSVPITLAMEHIMLKRSDDGVFHIDGELGLSASWFVSFFYPVGE